MDKKQIDEFMSAHVPGHLFDTTLGDIIRHDPNGRYGDSGFDKIHDDYSDLDTLFGAILSDPYDEHFDDDYMGEGRPLEITAKEAAYELAHGDWQPLTRENVMRAWVRQNRDEVNACSGLLDEMVTVDRVNVECPFGTLTAHPMSTDGFSDSIEVDLVTSDGQCRQLSRTEALRNGPDISDAFLHVLAWDGKAEYATETFCDPESADAFELGAGDLAEVRDIRRVSEVVQDALAEAPRSVIAWVDERSVALVLSDESIRLTPAEATAVVSAVHDKLSLSERIEAVINDQIIEEGERAMRARYGLDDLSPMQRTRLYDVLAYQAKVSPDGFDGLFDLDWVSTRDFLTDVAMQCDPDLLRGLVAEVVGRDPEHEILSTTETLARLDKAATRNAGSAPQTRKDIDTTHGRSL